MTSIVNLFSNFDDLTKPKSITDSATKYNNNNNEKLISLSLNQGSKFKKYQKKISNSLEKKANNLSGVEGFQTNTTQEPNLTDQTNDLLNTTDTSSQTQTIKNLQTQYNDTVNKYKSLLAKMSGTTTGYINRTNPNNPYLNKYISWSDNGAIMYVTNQGVAKHITNWTAYERMWGKNGCPTDKSIIKLDIPWDSSYLIEGTKIPTRPPLVVGTSISQAQSCSNEGNNVYVDKLLTSSTAKYNGCYADDSSSRTMTFIGGAPQTSSGIENGNFSQPTMQNDSYEYINSVSKVPGWNFVDAVLLNNSSAWGYPMPYPNGTQCACIQAVAYFEQTLNLSVGSYYLSFIACGRPGYSGANTIDIQLNGETFYSVTPPTTEWTVYKSSFSVTTSGNNIIKFLGTINDPNNSSAFQGILLENSGVSTTSGTYTYDMCKNEAFNGGYKYFALQNVNTETSMGYCAVSNDSIAATRNGTAYTITGGIPLWALSSQGVETVAGAYAYLTDQGALTVYNLSGASIYNTDNSTAQPSDYLGCYGDTKTRAMPLHNSGKQKYSYQECRDIAEDGNYKYFGLQNSTSGTNAQCALSNDLSSTTKYGKASNCTKLKDGTYSGGGWSNAVYSFDPTSFYYLILQDDGNMCIYRGTGPNDNQGNIWCSGTNGQQQKPDPKYTAAKGKYGKNWIASGSGLSAGDFVGSTDGSIYLLMQSDGNLVLFTSQDAENCQKMKDGNTGGGVDANALYEFNERGIPANMGKVAYVDSNSVLYPYPDSSIGLSNDYSSYSNYDSAGHDISGTSFSNATIDSCKTACNDLQNCYGFAFNKTNKICYPKDNTMFPKGSRTTNSTVDLYVRQPKITKTPAGITDKILNIDSLAYENYPKGSGDMKQSYNLSNATSVEKQQLDQLESTMSSLSSQLADLTTNYDTGSQNLEKQSQTNVKEIGGYLKDIENTNTKIKGFGTNINNILKDSDIVVLQKNYDYLFWSIIATATVLISINIVKK